MNLMWVVLSVKSVVMGKPPYRTRTAGIKEKKTAVLMRLRDEQHLTFKQIATQIRMTATWCSTTYKRVTKDRSARRKQ